MLVREITEISSKILYHLGYTLARDSSAVVGLGAGSGAGSCEDVDNSSNCFPRDLTALIQPIKKRPKKTPTTGVLIDTDPRVIISDWWINPLPDLPRRDPTPSIAAFPLSLDSGERGMKAISLVVSKKVNLHAREKIF